MAYLLIENPGEAPVDQLLLLGATNKDPETDPRLIGCFGSGAKLSILVCLRKDVYPQVFTGKTSLEWSIKPNEHKEVMVSVDKKTPKSTGATLGFGKYDWADNMSLALREFVSNALDAVGGNTHPMKCEIVNDNQVRAKAGYTRVFIPWQSGEQGELAKNNFLQRWFLHFRKDGKPHVAGPIAKATPSRAHFFRRGVLIRQWSQEGNSLYDYNFIDLTLDEARTADDWKLQYQAAKLLVDHPKMFARALVAVSKEPNIWEASLNSYGLREIKDTKKEEIKAEVLKSLGPNAVLTESTAGAQLAINKGREAVILPQGWVQAVDAVEGPTLARELGEHASKGVDIIETKPDHIAAVLKWVEVIKAAKLDGGMESPDVYSYNLHPSAATKTWGYCTHGEGVYFNAELGGEMLDTTVIEELAHWYSGASDFTREFQEFLLRLVARNLGE